MEEEALSGKIAEVFELDCSAEKLWEGVLHAHEIYPKILSDNFEAIEFIKGDCKSIGSIRKVIFTGAIPGMKELIERIDVHDHEKKKITYTVIDGDLLDLFKAFVATIEIVAKGDGGHGCILTWSLEYEKVSGRPPAPRVFVEKAKKGLQDLSAYLLRNQYWYIHSN